MRWYTELKPMLRAQQPRGGRVRVVRREGTRGKPPPAAPEAAGLAGLLALDAVADAADGGEVGVAEGGVVVTQQRRALEGHSLGKGERIAAVRAQVQAQPHGLGARVVLRASTSAPRRAQRARSPRVVSACAQQPAPRTHRVLQQLAQHCGALRIRSQNLAQPRGEVDLLSKVLRRGCKVQRHGAPRRAPVTTASAAHAAAKARRARRHASAERACWLAGGAVLAVCAPRGGMRRRARA